MWRELAELWPHVLFVMQTALAIAATCHAATRKREVRAAIGWIGVIWLSPFVGVALYLMFGVNRIQRRAQETRGRTPRIAPPDHESVCRIEQLAVVAGDEHERIQPLVRYVDRVTDVPLLAGNRIEALCGGEAAYGAMIRAIDEAEHSVTLSTFIFERDQGGQMFLEALQRAVARKIEVRVLVDAVGSRWFSWPSIYRRLKRAGVRTRRFLPSRLPWRLPYANLRNHRKVLVCDGRIGFTGGMNIRQEHLLESGAKHPVQDVHFRLTGPVVAHLQKAFVEDWEFTTGEHLSGEAWFPALAPEGEALARGIADGPDENFERARLIFEGGLACAQRSVHIATPYFLPDQALISSLSTAALRGVEVKIVLPLHNNHKVVHWASLGQMWQVLQWGCKVYFSPPPFDHTKLMVVDGLWSVFGSTNWDPRSLRLNFEFNVECYDRRLATELTELIETKIAAATPVRRADLDARSYAQVLRDGVARLASPYL
ncbi:MAG: cardiolipin synthase [Planctomycetes bacterium]|nr:cardiolipin synthase [Planctomycetota bacterium]